MPIIDFLVDALNRIPTAQTNDEKKNYLEVKDGHVNFVLTTIMKQIYHQQSYATYNRAIGVLECIKLEFYRRMVAPYEEKKIKENGDVE